MNIPMIRAEFARLARAAIHDRIDTHVLVKHHTLMFVIYDRTRRRTLEIDSNLFKSDRYHLASAVAHLKAEMES